MTSPEYKGNIGYDQIQAGLACVGTNQHLHAAANV